jgi:hypothetical protein
VVRYADDSVLGFQFQADAERFLEEWKERLRKFGLELHPDKTRLIEFGRFAAASRKQRGAGKPETFDFLGFTHICGQFGVLERVCKSAHGGLVSEQHHCGAERHSLLGGQHEPLHRPRESG